MKILIAEDHAVSRRVLETTLTRWGHNVLATSNGEDALAALLTDEAPAVAILDWMMPVMDGIDVCRRIRLIESLLPPYIILLTAKGGKEDMVAGLKAGADDYVFKPFDKNELHARVEVGIRVATLQRSLAQRVRELEEALSEVKQLHGILPICSYCKKIRDDKNYWQRVENYISDHTRAEFSHSVCPDCYEGIVGPELERMKSGRQMLG